ncbi:citrate lyase beta subunit [Phanerochaete sordida]|uniref:Citrate lyase beta subunit n=1 Tax=Phanerochaete sordida TaxID=48140 RepID=A0A9P3GBJ8_9APHY|nr:citrate lyase beta subunit [Phanerochaete sordida]
MASTLRLRLANVRLSQAEAKLTRTSAQTWLRCARAYSTPAAAAPTPKRSYLYVPASSDRTLNKSLVTQSDVIVYDLEDSVPPTRADKDGARHRLSLFIADKLRDGLPQPERLAVRVNAVNTPFFEADISQALAPSCIRTLVIPKVHSVQELDAVSERVHAANSVQETPNPVNIVASIESARALYNVGQIASWQSRFGPQLGGKLTALLFAAEDYCADTHIIRTKTRQELLYTRSQISITARVFGLESIDMVCVDYKDLEYLKDECDDGRRLGFTGKQAIHPGQVEVIQSSFLPSAKEILRAARILRQMEKAHSQKLGAAGLATEDGSVEMIDQPMIKQAENTIRMAIAAGLEIPKVE